MKPIATGQYDKHGTPVYVGDLIKVFHFTAAHRGRKCYMYKKVMLINDRIYAVNNMELGFKPTAECHKCYIKDCKDFEIIDGHSLDHPVDGFLVCWWERKRFLTSKGTASTCNPTPI
jgi:hypothetical protein